MSPRSAFLLLLLASGTTALSAACATGSDTNTTIGAGASTGTPSGSGGLGGASTSGGGDDGGLFDVPPTDGTGGSDTYVVYANTDTTLFKLDPDSLQFTPIGDFDCIPAMDAAMTDIAVDKSENIWGVSQHYVHPLTVQGGAVHCGTAIPFEDPNARFYGLTFAPVGVLDPTAEVLVAGNTAGELWAIDGQGKLSLRGNFGKVPANDGHGHAYAATNVGKPWELSGDIVFAANNGSPVGFATVRDCPNPPSTSGCNTENTLLELDLSKLAVGGAISVAKAVRGLITQRAGCNAPTDGQYGNMYGIAAWNDKVFGFSRTGNLADISPADGTACLVQFNAGYKFAGAGVTTIVPIIPPPE